MRDCFQHCSYCYHLFSISPTQALIMMQYFYRQDMKSKCIISNWKEFGQGCCKRIQLTATLRELEINFSLHLWVLQFPGNMVWQVDSIFVQRKKAPFPLVRRLHARLPDLVNGMKVGCQLSLIPWQEGGRTGRGDVPCSVQLAQLNSVPWTLVLNHRANCTLEAQLLLFLATFIWYSKIIDHSPPFLSVLTSRWMQQLCFLSVNYPLASKFLWLCRCSPLTIPKVMKRVLPSEPSRGVVLRGQEWMQRTGWPQLAVAGKSDADFSQMLRKRDFSQMHRQPHLHWPPCLLF